MKSTTNRCSVSTCDATFLNRGIFTEGHTGCTCIRNAGFGGKASDKGIGLGVDSLPTSGGGRGRRGYPGDIFEHPVGSGIFQEFTGTLQILLIDIISISSKFSKGVHLN